jgi:uncharacterized protein (DUF1800 family)
MSEQLSRRQFNHCVISGLGAAAIAGCQKSVHSTGATADVPLRRDISEDEPVWHVLNRLSYGPRPRDIDRVVSIGVDSYVEEQLASESIHEELMFEYRIAGLDTLSLPAADLRTSELEWVHDNPISMGAAKLMQLPIVSVQTEPGRVVSQLQQARVLRAAYSRRQLLEKMVEFWSDHFNVDQNKGDCRWLKTVQEREIRRHALGNFRDLLSASMHSPAMLVYLDNTISCRRSAACPAPPNENYARELLELHTLGVRGGYGLHDIQEVARCLTGWSVQSAWELQPGEFIFRTDCHDGGEKHVLGRLIPSGQGQQDGERLLDILCGHPSTAKFISEKLCRYFVCNEPSAKLVERLADAFLRTKGEIRQVLSTLFHSEEFQKSSRQKFKRPFNFVISALRSVDADTNGEGVIPYLYQMGHGPFRWPLPDGYPTTMESWLPTLKVRWQFAIDLMEQRISGTVCPEWPKQLGENALESLRVISRMVLGRALPNSQAEALVAASYPTVTNRNQLWTALCLSSPQFQLH